MKRGHLLAGLAAAAAVVVIALRGKAAPPSLVEQYLKDIAACLTLDALAAVRVRFEADLAAAKLTRAEYDQVYDAYIKRYGELTTVTTFLDIRFEPPDAYMPAPTVTVDGVLAGTAPILFPTTAGTHTIAWQEKPGGDNPSPGVLYYQASAPQTVTVVEGQTLMLFGVYTIVPTSPPDITLDAFNFGDAQPFLPSSTHIAYINVTNPTDRTIRYLVYAYPSDPGDTGETVGIIGQGELVLSPGSWSTQFSITVPTAEGTYPIWLRFYEWGTTFQTFIKRVNTGKTATVQGPTGWPIETQLASIMPYLVLAGVWRESLYWTYQPANPGATNLFELFVGETVEINVTQPCTLVYSGWTWSLAAGYNTIVWGSPPPPPPPPVTIEDQLASIIYPPYLVDVWVYRGGEWLVYAYPPIPQNTLQELYAGETVYIEVLQNCVLSYGGKTWNLAAGENTITW